jgi:hypothetical protein
VFSFLLIIGKTGKIIFLEKPGKPFSWKKAPQKTSNFAI